MDKNEELRVVQTKWVEEVLEKYITDCAKDKNLRDDKQAKRKNCEISCPFCMGLTEDYIHNKDNKTKVMIIGQEPWGFDCWKAYRENFYKDIKSKNSHISLQNWAISFLDVQLRNIGISEIKYHSSPFWRFFRELNKNYLLCWNNIDKVYYGEESNGYRSGTLTYLAEEELSSPFSYDGKEFSLVKREIEIADPDVVLFATGPYRALSMGTALEYKNVSKESINGIRPTIKEPIVKLNDIKCKNKKIQVLWTYHPGCLVQKCLFNVVIDEIKKLIEKKL